MQDSVPQPVRHFKKDALHVEVFNSQPDMALNAAHAVREYLIERLALNGSVRAILATGNSQIQFLKTLIELGGVDWSKVTLFHMDEYLGISANHKASFRLYMRERVESLVQPEHFHYLDGDASLPLDECERYTCLLKEAPIDLCCLGVGENGHIAFNDPPVADFQDPHLVKLVKLDDACKMQQVNEGHFESLETVPPYAFTLTIPALCLAEKIVCLSPETRKAAAVKAALEGPIGTACPASALRQQSKATMYLDQDSVALLDH
jgi:glucosamine-6-phosphate deaminase